MPANAMRGEAEYAGRKFVADFNSVCTLEQLSGLKVPQLVGLLSEGLGFADLRLWLYCFQTGAQATERELGELCGKHGYEEGVKAVAAAFEGFFAPLKEGGDESPPKAE